MTLSKKEEKRRKKESWVREIMVDALHHWDPYDNNDISFGDLTDYLIALSEYKKHYLDSEDKNPVYMVSSVELVKFLPVLERLAIVKKKPGAIYQVERLMDRGRWSWCTCYVFAPNEKLAWDFFSRKMRTVKARERISMWGHSRLKNYRLVEWKRDEKRQG